MDDPHTNALERRHGLGERTFDRTVIQNLEAQRPSVKIKGLLHIADSEGYVVNGSNHLALKPPGSSIVTRVNRSITLPHSACLRRGRRRARPQDDVQPDEMAQAE